MDHELVKEVRDLISLYLGKKHTSVSYALMLDGELVAADALGTTGGRNSKPADLDCTYNVASISKVYTTACVMKLVEEGKLELDAPVINYIPDFRTANAGYDKITLRQCLSHSCALPGTQWVDFSVSDMSRVDYYKDALDFYAHSYLKAEPGKFSVYCNDGFTLAEMAVAAVCEEKNFAEFSRIHLTDPMGAYSSRFAGSYHPDHPMIAQGKGPKEIVTARGLGGLTTTMTDLALFGCQFLPGACGRERILSEASIKEITKPQGKSFLKKDNSAPAYGLGWDNVNYTHPEYDLGEGAMRKGGASFQFGTNFTVVPKYNAVIAMSQTYDCELAPRDLCLKILEMALDKRGIHISKFKTVPEKLKQKWTGTYLDNANRYKVSFHGSRMYLFNENSEGKRSEVFPALGYNGRDFTSADGHKVLMEAYGRKKYLLTSFLGLTEPMCEKVENGRELSASWKKRMDKTYVNVSVSSYDEIIGDMMAAMTLKEIPEAKGSFWAVCANGESITDCPVRPVNAAAATGFLDTPDNAARDLATLMMKKEGKTEYMKAVSYEYREASSLAAYTGKVSVDKVVAGAAESGRSAALVISEDHPLTSLKDLIEEYRVVVITKELRTVTDSLMKVTDEKTGEPEGFREVKEGFLLAVKR